MSLSLFEKHTCREQSLEGNCAVCHEYLFDSPMPIKELPCSHFMHSTCFQVNRLSPCQSSQSPGGTRSLSPMRIGATTSG